MPVTLADRIEWHKSRPAFAIGIDNHAMNLWKFPELIIGYEADSVPTEAACSLCGERMPTADPPFPDAKDTIAAFSIEFALHVRAAHPGFTPN